MAGTLDIGLQRRRALSLGLPPHTLGADFVAIDFETANTSRSSACAIGIAVVRDGIVESRGSTLIDPEAEFSPYNSAITGIYPDDVVDAPTFDALWPTLADLLEGQTVVAHVATFDLGVLRQAVAKYCLPGIDMNALCSWRLARRTWPAYPAFGLSYLSGELGLDLDHHEAGSDASASAEIVLAAQRLAGASNLNELCALLDISLGSLSADSFVGVDAGGTLLNSGGDLDSDPNHPLYGMTICFTGAMYSMTRREASELVTNVGADFKNNMSASVDMLVVGDADFVRFADGQQTGKMERAAKLRLDGEDIEIIAERDFLALL